MRKEKRTKSYVNVGDSTLVVTGDIRSRKSIELHGAINGNITGEENVIIAADCVVTGNIHCDSLYINGKINGNVFTNLTVINSTGEIGGDITTKLIRVEAGGFFLGNCKMSKGTESSGVD